MLIAAVLMWALCRWWPIAHGIGRPWNRLGALPVAIGVAIAVDAVRRFRHARTTVNPNAGGLLERLGIRVDMGRLPVEIHHVRVEGGLDIEIVCRAVTQIP
jgi:hypothetical protein